MPRSAETEGVVVGVGRRAFVRGFGTWAEEGKGGRGSGAVVAVVVVVVVMAVVMVGVINSGSGPRGEAS